MRHGIRVLAALGATAAALTLTAQPASANSFGPLFADNKAHSFFYDDDLSSKQRSGMDWARKKSLAGPTDMTTSVNRSYNKQVDVWSYATWNPTGDQKKWYAWTTCVKRVSGSSKKCDQFTIVFNNKVPHSNYKSLSCHEIGHSVGLGHASGKNSSYTSANRSCMRGNPDHNYYSKHDKKHINGRY
ncbi:hypothetical protein [Streptomyces sp. TRM49041]|uniref:hypothetical protein n=1 Tax=Streptomyces sp. TRM49041 TaxID=2603216 RepID=UPI0021CC9B06|nr:hypothetical protein [Streptomyces sp. TRM49041]